MSQHPPTPRLAVVPPTVPGAVQTIAERISSLQAEARVLANDHVAQMLTLLTDLERVGLDISEGGEAYPVGVREIARRLAEDSGMAAQTLEAVHQRARGR